MMTPLADSGINHRLVKLCALHFDENADENLSAVVYNQCRIFKDRIFKPQHYKIMWRLCRIDDGLVSSLILIITKLCNNLNILCLTWHELGEVRWKITAPHIILDWFQSLCQKLSELVEISRSWSYDKKNFACFLRPVYQLTISRYVHKLSSVLYAGMHTHIHTYIQYRHELFIYYLVFI